MRVVLLSFVLSHLYSGEAHYIFSKISHNGGPISEQFQYVRPLTDGPLTDGTTGDLTDNANPYYDLYSPNVRCGRGAATSGRGIKTLVVNAGDQIEFWATQRDRLGKVKEIKSPIYHEGPGQAYLSKAPGALEVYEGDGDWFKIGSIVSSDGKNWDAQHQYSMNFTIPRTTPAGNYLMRVDHIFPISTHWNVTQLYISCAHVEIQGPGGGKPGPLVKFPGAYDVFDRGIWAPYKVTVAGIRDLTGYTAPGPAVWKG